MIQAIHEPVISHPCIYWFQKERRSSPTERCCENVKHNWRQLASEDCVHVSHVLKVSVISRDEYHRVTWTDDTHDSELDMWCFMVFEVIWRCSGDGWVCRECITTTCHRLSLIRHSCLETLKRIVNCWKMQLFWLINAAFTLTLWKVFVYDWWWILLHYFINTKFEILFC